MNTGDFVVWAWGVSRQTKTRIIYCGQCWTHTAKAAEQSYKVTAFCVTCTKNQLIKRPEFAHSHHLSQSDVFYPLWKHTPVSVWNIPPMSRHPEIPSSATNWRLESSASLFTKRKISRLLRWTFNTLKLHGLPIANSFTNFPLLIFLDPSPDSGSYLYCTFKGAVNAKAQLGVK